MNNFWTAQHQQAKFGIDVNLFSADNNYFRGKYIGWLLMNILGKKKAFGITTVDGAILRREFGKFNIMVEILERQKHRSISDANQIRVRW